MLIVHWSTSAYGVPRAFEHTEHMNIRNTLAHAAHEHTEHMNTQSVRNTWHMTYTTQKISWWHRTHNIPNFNGYGRCFTFMLLHTCCQNNQLWHQISWNYGRRYTVIAVAWGKRSIFKCSFCRRELCKRFLCKHLCQHLVSRIFLFLYCLSELTWLELTCTVNLLCIFVAYEKCLYSVMVIARRVITQQSH